MKLLEVADAVHLAGSEGLLSHLEVVCGVTLFEDLFKHFIFK